MEPLRPELYAQLQRVFGSVKVHHASCEMRYEVDEKTGELLPDMNSMGEYYAVNCPFCHDTRYRLWINYLWGKNLPGQPPWMFNTWLCVCYNEGCVTDVERQKALYHDVFDWLQEERDEVLPGQKRARSVEFAWPGDVRLLSQLKPDHRALTWLRDERGYNIEEVSNLHNATFCVQAHPGPTSICQNRIIIPCFENNNPVGYQARYLGPCGKDKIKYWTMSGWHCGQHLYNYDWAKQSPTVVVCEGPLDVWRFGPEAVCVFKHDISDRQLTLLAEWPQIVLLLDGDVTDQKGLGRVTAKLKKITGSRFIHVKLPEELDPGDIKREELRDMVYRQAAAAGFVV